MEHPETPTHKKIWNWILERGGCIVYGGRYINEIKGMREFMDMLGEWQKGGRAFREIDEKVNKEEKYLREKCQLRSDDHHIVALASVSGTRNLYTDDDDLMNDFKNQLYINKPRGKIYTSHRHTLDHCKCCPVTKGRVVNCRIHSKV